MNFWENLTPLDSSHLEVFLGFFRNFSFFWIQIWILNLGRFGTGPNQNRTGPVWPVTSQIGPVPTDFVNPDCEREVPLVADADLVWEKNTITGCQQNKEQSLIDWRIQFRHLGYLFARRIEFHQAAPQWAILITIIPGRIFGLGSKSRENICKY